MRKISGILLILFSAGVINLSAAGSCLDLWRAYSHSEEKVRLTEWIRSTARGILYKQKNFNDIDFNLPAQPDCTGLFITLIKKGRVRGCFGAFSHSHGSASEILHYYIKGALSLDPRHDPLERSEFDETDIILTVTSEPEPVSEINNVDISNYGVLIECDDSSKTVIVPAEYKTSSGIMKVKGKSVCRYYKFRGVTIK